MTSSLFPQDHQLPNKKETNGKVYCKYHNSWNHNTNACWSFRNIIQNLINKGILKFPEKKDVMVIDEDPIPPVASVNIVAIGLKVVLKVKNDGRFSPNIRIRKVWIPKQYMVHRDELTVKRRISTTKENEKNGRYPYHSKQEIKKEKSFKGKNVSLRERHFFREKGHEHFKEENSSKVCCPSSCLTWTRMACGAA